MKKLFIDLFSGSGSFKKEAEVAGFEYFGVDWCNYESANLNIDIEFLRLSDLPNLHLYEKIHMHISPDCTTYTIAAISTHRNGTEPKSEYALKCDNVLKNVIHLIECIENEFRNIFTYDFENPRGMLRKMPFMKRFPRYTVWYCQYGDDRAKPTDIWTNLNWTPKPVCKNGNPDCNHIRAPRGSATGTQGRKGSFERSKIPNDLCREIIQCI